MNNLWVQYIFIIFLFGFAIWYIYKMIKKSFNSNNGGSCSKGCGCSNDKK